MALFMPEPRRYAPLQRNWPHTGDTLFRLAQLHAARAGPAVRAQPDGRSRADPFAWELVCFGVALCGLLHARVCGWHRAARRVDARHAASDRGIAVDARGVLDRAPSAVPREHARGARVRAAVGHMVSAADRRAAELHLSRADRRAGRSVSAERVRRQLSRMGERGPRDDARAWQVPIRRTCRFSGGKCSCRNRTGCARSARPF